MRVMAIQSITAQSTVLLTVIMLDPFFANAVIFVQTVVKFFR